MGEKGDLGKAEKYAADGENKQKRTCWQKVQPYLLLIMLAAGMVIAIALGIGMRALDPPLNSSQLIYFKFPGDLLMRMLKLLILPLIVTSLVAGMAALDARASGRMGGIAVAYYLLTTLCAVILGMILVSAIRPGVGHTKGEIEKASKSPTIVKPADALLDLVRNAFPNNIVTTCFKQTRTIYVNKKETPKLPDFSLSRNASDEERAAFFVQVTKWIEANAAGGIGDSMNKTNMTGNPAPSESTGTPKITEVDGLNVLGLVVFSVVFGIIIGRMGKKGKPLVDFFEAFHLATMRMIKLVIWYAPVGIIFLLAYKIITTDDPVKLAEQLGMYALTVLVGLAIHAIVILPIIYLVLVRKNPLKFVLGVGQALIHALATASSSATLPLTMRCLEEDCGIDPRVTHFVAPVGATINMDGTALYEAVAAIFIAQLNGMWPMDVGKLITISITATAAAIGAAGVPEGGLVTMAIVLTAVGLPPEDTSLILAIDWFLDRFRTCVNVWGDAVGTAVVQRFATNFLDKLDTEEKQKENGGIGNQAFEPTEDNTDL